MRQPTFFIPHGGGPCFFMDDPQRLWAGMSAFLRGFADGLAERPSAILLVSSHWESDGFAFTGGAQPSLIFDYRGFPPHTYRLRYDAPGDPALARRAAALLDDAGFTASVDERRGWDHGVFVPLMLAFPDADVPVVEMSLDRRLAPEAHLAAGGALAPLRDEGVLIIGSGMSFHNMAAAGDPRFTEPSRAFDGWLTEAATMTRAPRAERLAHWADAPAGRLSHPREEHLIPLMVAAGAAEGAGQRVYGEQIGPAMVSGFRFD